MKAVLISIQPKWCELIASGKKTVEVRKTRPKLETPFKVYIYCTQGTFADLGIIGQTMYEKRMKVIGEFVCDRIRCEKEVADGLVDIVLESTSCVAARELVEYARGNVLYSWHISDLVIYEKPRELSEFMQVKKIRGYHKKDEPKTEGINIQRLLHSNRAEVKYLTRPPQSWAYVEVSG